MIKTNEKLTQEVDQLKSEIRKIYMLIGHAKSTDEVMQSGKESLRAAADAKKAEAIGKFLEKGVAIPVKAMPPKKALNETSNETTRA